MTPEERDELFRPCTPRSQERPRAERRGSPGKPGGISRPCGCRYARTGGQWVHVTPCRSHQLAACPIGDEAAQGLLTA